MPETRRILITGATRGLGRAMARRFASMGHQVLACGRSAEGLESLASELGEGHGPLGGDRGGKRSHAVERLDVTDAAAVEAWAARLLAEGGPPDLVLNNAALANRLAPLWEVPEEEFSTIVDVNVKGVVNVVRAFLPAMIERGRGVVVNFSSGWGHSTAPNVAPYCATKFAIEGLTRALAQELPPDLAAVPLSPGIINTDMLQRVFAEEADSYPSPEEWIDVAAPFILGLGPKDNGQSLRVPVN